MGKENRTKSDNLAWIKALLFPKKSKPATPAQASVSDTQPHARAASAPAGQPAKSAQPASQKSFLPTFWTVTSIISMTVNVIFVIVVLVLVRELFTIKALVGDELLGGLYNNFVLMDKAHIRTTIEVKADVPVQFTLPVRTNTSVQLTEDTRINGARVSLSTGGLNILSAPTNIVLPAGTDLPIALDITVPVDTTIPITLQVPVDIPLAETELHEPFVGLQNVVDDYYFMLMPEIKGPQDVPFCQPIMWLCKAIFRSE